MTRLRDGGSRRRWQLLAAGIGVLVVVLVAGYWFFVHGPGQRLLSPPGSTVAEFSGTGDQMTGSFQVREGWQIHWDSESARFSFAIRGDRDFGTVIQLEEPTSGITAPVGGGTFNLEVSADGPWSIAIIQGD